MYVRSILTFHLLPIYAQGLISPLEIDNLELKILASAGYQFKGAKTKALISNPIKGLGLLSAMIEKQTVKASLDDVIRIGHTEFYMAARLTLQDKEKLMKERNDIWYDVRRKEFDWETVGLGQLMGSNRLEPWPHYYYCTEHKELLNKEHMWTCANIWANVHEYATYTATERRDKIVKHLNFLDKNIPDKTVSEHVRRACMAL
jgi:hypothetical protein